MSGTGTAAAPAQAEPWRAAWTAWLDVISPDRSLTAVPLDAEADAQWRQAWEAAAQAAIEAAPPAIIHLHGELSEADVARLREKFGEAVRTGRPQAVPELGAVAYEAAENAPLRRQMDDLTRERDSLTGRVAELVTEGNELRALVGEILTGFNSATGEWYLTGVSREQIVEWRERAGLEA